MPLISELRDGKGSLHHRKPISGGQYLKAHKGPSDRLGHLNSRRGSSFYLWNTTVKPRSLIRLEGWSLVGVSSGRFHCLSK